MLHGSSVTDTRIINPGKGMEEGIRMTIRTIVAAAAVAAVLGAGLAGAQVQVDPALASYKATSGVSGNVSSIGSDSLNNLMTLWAEQFNKFYPNAKIQIEGKGSSTAPPALISGTAQLGPMSREMKGTEIDQFEKKYGYKPTAIRTSVDALALFVNKDNPIKCLTLAQVDAVFSKSRRAGYKEDIKTWGQLGLTGEWASRPISLYGRNSASGTYGADLEARRVGGAADLDQLVVGQREAAALGPFLQHGLGSRGGLRMSSSRGPPSPRINASAASNPPSR